MFASSSHHDCPASRVPRQQSGDDWWTGRHLGSGSVIEKVEKVASALPSGRHRQRDGER